MAGVTGVIETALYVEDVPRSIQFYERLFGFEKLVCDNHFCAFNVAGRQVLLLFQKGANLEPIPTPGGTIPPHNGSGQLHLALGIAPADFEQWEQQLHQQGIAIESRVNWPRGGSSLYFRDPDGHLVELVTPGCWAIY